MNPRVGFERCRIAGEPRTLAERARRTARGRFALGVFAAISIAGCARSTEAPRPASNPVTIRALLPTHAGDERALVLPGRVKADEEVTLTARVAARITSLPLREGARFPRGATLAVFDAPEARDALAAARADLEAARVRRARARLQEARLDSLFVGRVVARADLELAQVDRQAAEAAYAQAQAALASWEDGTRLVAPFDGVVVRRRADPGQSLQSGMPVLDLRSTRAAEVLAAVPESELPRLASARASLAVADGAWRPARLAWLEGMTDPATRTRLAHFVPADGAARLEPGAFARVQLESAGAATPAAAGVRGDGATRLSVPASSLVRRGELAGVYVVEDRRVHLRWLRIGRIEGDRVEVLAGLWPDDSVAVDPTGLADGALARVELQR